MKYAYPLLYLAISITCLVIMIVLNDKTIDKDLKTKETCNSAPVSDTECRIWNDGKCYKAKIKDGVCMKEASTPVVVLALAVIVFFVMACFKAYMVYSGK